MRIQNNPILVSICINNNMKTGFREERKMTNCVFLPCSVDRQCKKMQNARAKRGACMNLITVFLIAVGLAMDAFAVSVSTGMTVCDFNWRHNLKMSLMFGIFQFAMPVAGFFGAANFRSYIESFDHWIAFALLLLIGGKMLWEAIFSKIEAELLENAPNCPVPYGDAVQSSAKKGLMAAELLTSRRLLVLAVATSIDALAVGVSMAFLQTDIWWPSVLIGIVAFVFSYAGGFLGCRIGPVLGKIAEIAGGLILIGIGVKILLDHLLFY